MLPTLISTVKLSHCPTNVVAWQHHESCSTAPGMHRARCALRYRSQSRHVLGLAAKDLPIGANQDRLTQQRWGMGAPYEFINQQ